MPFLDWLTNDADDYPDEERPAKLNIELEGFKPKPEPQPAPCPFCDGAGGPPIVQLFLADPEECTGFFRVPTYRVVCVTCGACGPVNARGCFDVIETSKEARACRQEARDAWAKRVL